MSAGLVTSGGKGWTQLRLTFGAGASATAGRGVILRERTGGGGCVPGGTPSASRKRRTRSCSDNGGVSLPDSLGGGGGGGCSADSPPDLVSHLKIVTSPTSTRRMTVSFIWEMMSDE